MALALYVFLRTRVRRNTYLQWVVSDVNNHNMRRLNGNFGRVTVDTGQSDELNFLKDSAIEGRLGHGRMVHATPRLANLGSDVMFI